MWGVRVPIKEHDSVVLSRPLPEHGLLIGVVNAVVFVHRNNEAYEVEFIAGDGNTVGVVTLKPKDIRALMQAKPSMTAASRHEGCVATRDPRAGQC